MSVLELLQQLGVFDLFWSIGGGAASLATLVQIAPVKIYPWTWLCRKFGKAINGEVLDKVETLSKKIEEVDRKTDVMAEKEDMKSAVSCRVRILRFGDELLHNMSHSKEHFDQILLDITEYEAYCKDHPNFVNNITKHTIMEIENTYQHLLDTHGFLQ